MANPNAIILNKLCLKRKMHPKLPDYRELEGMADAAASNLTMVAEVVVTTVKSLATTGMEATREMATTVAPMVTEATRAVLATTTTPTSGQDTYLAATTAPPALTSSTTRAADQCQVT